MGLPGLVPPPPFLIDLHPMKQKHTVLRNEAFQRGQTPITFTLSQNDWPSVCPVFVSTTSFWLMTTQTTWSHILAMWN